MNESAVDARPEGMYFWARRVGEKTGRGGGGASSGAGRRKAGRVEVWGGEEGGRRLGRKRGRWRGVMWGDRMVGEAGGRGEARGEDDIVMGSVMNCLDAVRGATLGAACGGGGGVIRRRF